jgi:hypothetical protein
MITAEANPWANVGWPAEAEAHFELIAQDPTCGSVDAEWLQPPSSLAAWYDATFAFQPASQPGAHVDPIIDCAGTHASPL